MIVEAGGMVSFEPRDADVRHVLVLQVGPIEVLAVQHGLVGRLGLGLGTKGIHAVRRDSVAAVAANVLAESSRVAEAIRDLAKTDRAAVEENAIWGRYAVVD